MVNRALLELDAADALTPEAQIATLSRREVEVLFDPYLTAVQVATQIKSISAHRAVALRRALGVSKDALGSVMRKEGKSRAQILRLIEFERLEDAARLINVPSKVVVEVRKCLGLIERPYEPRIDLHKAMQGIFAKTGTKTLAGLKRKLGDKTVHHVEKDLGLTTAQTHLLFIDMGLDPMTREEIN